jgi:cell division topological specificity factor
MSFLSFLLGQKKTTSAVVAKERLQIILAHERTGKNTSPDYLPQLQQELLAVISKYVNINLEDIKVQLERQDTLEVLEVKIEMPQKEAQKEA